MLVESRKEVSPQDWQKSKTRVQPDLRSLLEAQAVNEPSSLCKGAAPGQRDFWLQCRCSKEDVQTTTTGTVHPRVLAKPSALALQSLHARKLDRTEGLHFGSAPGRLYIAQKRHIPDICCLILISSTSFPCGSPSLRSSASRL